MAAVRWGAGMMGFVTLGMNGLRYVVLDWIDERWGLDRFTWPKRKRS
jgi:hypothetical protein